MSDHNTLRWERISNLLLVVSGEGPVSDEHWGKLITDMRELPIDTYFGISLGTIRVTSVQRKLASDVAKERGLSTVILTDDRLVRGFVTAVSWLGTNIKAYPSTDIEHVLTLLEVDKTTKDTLLEAALRLREGITTPS